ncbi:MAG: hypothetical protein ACOCV2_08885, partial [Persicimonas sp.]
LIRIATVGIIVTSVLAACTSDRASRVDNGDDDLADDGDYHVEGDENLPRLFPAAAVLRVPSEDLPEMLASAAESDELGDLGALAAFTVLSQGGPGTRDLFPVGNTRRKIEEAQTLARYLSRELDAAKLDERRPLYVALTNWPSYSSVDAYDRYVYALPFEVPTTYHVRVVVPVERSSEADPSGEAIDGWSCLDLVVSSRVNGQPVIERVDHINAPAPDSQARTPAFDWFTEATEDAGLYVNYEELNDLVNLIKAGHLQVQDLGQRQAVRSLSAALIFSWQQALAERAVWDYLFDPRHSEFADLALGGDAGGEGALRNWRGVATRTEHGADVAEAADQELPEVYEPRRDDEIGEFEAAYNHKDARRRAHAGIWPHLVATPSDSGSLETIQPLLWRVVLQQPGALLGIASEWSDDLSMPLPVVARAHLYEPPEDDARDGTRSDEQADLMRYPAALTAAFDRSHSTRTRLELALREARESAPGELDWRFVTNDEHLIVLLSSNMSLEEAFGEDPRTTNAERLRVEVDSDELRAWYEAVRGRSTSREGEKLLEKLPERVGFEARAEPAALVLSSPNQTDQTGESAPGSLDDLTEVVDNSSEVPTDDACSERMFESLTGLSFDRLLIPFHPASANERLLDKPLDVSIDEKLEDVEANLEECLQDAETRPIVRSRIGRQFLADGFLSQSAYLLADAAILYERGCTWGDSFSCRQARRLDAFETIETPETGIGDDAILSPFDPLFVVDKKGNAWVGPREVGDVEALAESDERALGREFLTTSDHGYFRRNRIEGEDGSAPKTAVQVAVDHRAPVVETLEALASSGFRDLSDVKLIAVGRKKDRYDRGGPDSHEFSSVEFTLERDDQDARAESIEINEGEAHLEADADWGELFKELYVADERAIRLRSDD